VTQNPKPGPESDFEHLNYQKACDQLGAPTTRTLAPTRSVRTAGRGYRPLPYPEKLVDHRAFAAMEALLKEMEEMRNKYYSDLAAQAEARKPKRTRREMFPDTLRCAMRATLRLHRVRETATHGHLKDRGVVRPQEQATGSRRGRW